MVQRNVVKGILAVCVAGAVLLPFACGGGGGGGGDDTKSEEVSPAQEVQATGALVSFPEGSLPPGGKAEILETTAPAEFTALTEAPAASKAYEIKGSDKDGNTVEEASKPFTLAIDLTEAAGLKEQDKTADNLCVVAKYLEKLYVWRKGGFTVAEGNLKISVDTAKFGLYMAIYCGTLDMEGFTAVAGEKPTVAETPAQEIVCDMTNSEYYPGRCEVFPEFLREPTQSESLSNAENDCKDNKKGVFSTVGSPGTELEFAL